MLLIEENGDFNLLLFVNPEPVEVFFLVILTMSNLASLSARSCNNFDWLKLDFTF